MRPLADGAVLLELTNAEALDLAAALTAARPDGLLDAVPGARTLLVLFANDVLRVTFQPWKFITLNVTQTLAHADVDVTVVDRTNHHLFQPLLYQDAAGILPEGLIVKRGSMAASKVFRVRGGVQYDHSGQYAAFGPFEYS